MNATIGQELNNAGTISSGGTLDISAATATVTNSGVIVAQADEIRAQGAWADHAALTANTLCFTEES